ncbi:serine/threonine protein kinase [Roseomonas sp. CCTCC AB2023176]|uniref:serine/threonine protein kinase n=1 Tax=Roseomonas sp. CCTCC AB2023176 TaxID=3342640 RepID=UPI0035DBCB87
MSHLDVKPANILFREDGAAVLVDFGLSNHGQLPDLLAEEIRIPLGTAPYMAPRQTLGLRDDPRSDLFALGVVMYELATGVLPFGNPQDIRAARRRLWRDPVPPRRLRSDIPPWLQELILRCLEPEPGDRHPGAGALAFDLRNPEGIRLTARAEKSRRDPWLTAIQRRINLDTSPARSKPAEAAHTAPIVVIALDPADTSAELGVALRRSLGNVIAARPGARVACVNVIVQGILSGDAPLDEDGRSVRVQRLVELRHWAAPLGLPEGRVTFHVLEGPSAGAAIVDYAAANGADHVVIGARTEAVLRKRLGTVAAEVVTNAPCSTTVVRPRH